MINHKELVAKPGTGVFFLMTGGNDRSHQVISEAVGRVIASARLIDRKALEIKFEDGYAIRLRDRGQTCLESRYITTDDELDGYVGAELLSVETADARTGDWGESNTRHDIQFLRVRTSLGVITCETHNEHNGYYGGFWVVARELEEDERENAGGED